MSPFYIVKKNTYALKTPRVVAIPFIYGVEYIMISNYSLVDGADLQTFFCDPLQTSPYSGFRSGMMYIEK